MNLVWRRRAAGGVWAVGFLVAAVWGGVEHARVEARGLGYAPPVHVAALEGGQLAHLGVALHDDVRVGQTIAHLDPGPLIDVREIVSARLLASQEDQVTAALTEARRFAQGLEGSMLDRASVATRLVEDRALLQSLQEQWSIEQDLWDHGAASSQSVRDLERRMRVVEARLVAGQEALAVADGATSAARARSETAPEANQWEVVEVARELEALDGRIRRLQLTSVVEGRVTAVYHTPGEIVQPGDPVVQIRRVRTDEVVAWLPASATGRIGAGQPARVVRANGEVIQAETISVGVGLQPLPLSLLYDPQRAEFGVPVRIRLTDRAVSPDEPITLKL